MLASPAGDLGDRGGDTQTDSAFTRAKSACALGSTMPSSAMALLVAPPPGPSKDSSRGANPGDTPRIVGEAILYDEWGG